MEFLFKNTGFQKKAKNPSCGGEVRFCPLGMQLVSSSNSIKVSWYWALNGIFGVLFSAAAVFISIYAGISVNFYMAAIFYACLSLIVRKQIS